MYYMMGFVKILAYSAFLVALLMVSTALVFLTPIPTNLGFYRWVSEISPETVGLSRAYLHGVSWGYSFDDLHKTNLTGQNAIVVGSNSGIGYEMTLALTQLGAKVTMLCRDIAKCETAAKKIRREEKNPGSVRTMTIDTSSLSSVKSFAEAYMKEETSLDMLFLNAGAMNFDLGSNGCLPLSEDGIEIMFATNYLGHHLLYRLLEPLLSKSKLARVVQTSSSSSFRTYSYKVATDVETLNGCKEPSVKNGLENLAYGQSKLAQILWTRTLAKRLGSESNIFVNAFNPGAVNTKLWSTCEKTGQPSSSAFIQQFLDWMRSGIMWTSAEGALTGLFLGVATDRLVKDKIRGKYFHPQAIEVVNPLAQDDELGVKLWEFSESLVKDFIQDEITESKESQDEKSPPNAEETDSRTESRSMPKGEVNEFSAKPGAEVS